MVYLYCCTSNMNRMLKIIIRDLRLRYIQDKFLKYLSVRWRQSLSRTYAAASNSIRMGRMHDGQSKALKLILISCKHRVPWISVRIQFHCIKAIIEIIQYLEIISTTTANLSKCTQRKWFMRLFRDWRKSISIYY